MSYRDLVQVDVNVDVSYLEERLDQMSERVDAVVTEDSVQEMIRQSNSDLEDRVSTLEGLNTCGKDINNLITDDEARDIAREAVDDLDYPSEDRVQEMIDSMGFLTDSEVRDIVDERSSDLDEDTVRSMIDEAIQQADNADVRDLERRFELYATRVDEQGQMLRALNERLDIFAERLGDSTVGDALTLMDLLRRAAAILGIGGRA